MSSNTPSQSPSPQCPPPPRFEWLHPSVDAPRMAWPDWLMLVSEQLAADFPGETGLFLASVVGALGYRAHELGAISPSEHERLAQEESDRSAAYLEALRAECAQPGAWVIIPPDPDDSDLTGGWGGHESQPDFGSEDGPIRGWLSRDSEDETFLN